MYFWLFLTKPVEYQWKLGKGGGWEAPESPTWSPKQAMANTPYLPCLTYPPPLTRLITTYSSSDSDFRYNRHGSAMVYIISFWTFPVRSLRRKYISVHSCRLRRPSRFCTWSPALPSMHFRISDIGSIASTLIHSPTTHNSTCLETQQIHSFDLQSSRAFNELTE